MPLPAATPSRPGSWPITVGAEGIAAAQFARCGFDVLVQAGHDKPWYDLVVTRAGSLLKVAVKPSEDGRWCLTQSYQRQASNLGGKKTDGYGAIDRWLDIHGSRTVYCLVQFEGVDLNQLPRVYLASPAEIAHHMRETVDRVGDSILYERYEWVAPDSSQTSLEFLPSNWRFSYERIQDLLSPPLEPAVAVPAFHRDPATIKMPARAAEALHTDMLEAMLTA